MVGASRAESEKFVKASGATEKVFLPPNLAAYGIAHHLLRDRRRRSSSALSWDTPLGEYEARDEVSQCDDERQEQ